MAKKVCVPLKSPVRRASGSMRRCKLKKKTPQGRKLDRAKRSKEPHEVKYRKSKRKKR